MNVIICPKSVINLYNKKNINNNSLQRYYNIHYLHYNTNLNNELLDRNIIIRFTDD